jgi:hypothetical protein
VLRYDVVNSEAKSCKATNQILFIVGHSLDNKLRTPGFKDAHAVVEIPTNQAEAQPVPVKPSRFDNVLDEHSGCTEIHTLSFE